MAAILGIIIGIVQFIIGFRFVFLLVGANPDNAFVSWIYNLSAPLIAPFSGLLGQSGTTVSDGAVVQSVVDWTSLIALVVYGVIGALLMRATGGFAHRPYYR